MPVSTERHSGFPISKWELNYLRCRYKAHRNKIAAAKPAIDANAPPERPHVAFKQKRALQEERRQMQVVQENFRLLGRTINIMASTDMPTQFSNSVARSSLSATNTTTTSVTTTNTKGESSDHDLAAFSTKESSGNSPKAGAAGKKELKAQHETECSPKENKNMKEMRASNRKYFDRPLTAKLKRNTHIIFHWFIQRFGRYVPWWAEINY